MKACRMNSKVWHSISALRERLDNNGGYLEIQYDHGHVDRYTCIFRKPATDDQIETVKKRIKYSLPSDYLDFLRICNGCLLFSHPIYGSEVHLYGTDEILKYNNFALNDERIRIAYINQDFIVLDSKDVQEGTADCLYVCIEHDPLEDAKPLGCSFETFLDRLIISRGSSFWYWGYRTP